MNKASHASKELRAMDELSSGSSAIHRLHPLVKLLITILYIAVVVSFDKYDLGGIVPMVLYPIIVFQMSGIGVETCFYKLRIVFPLVLAVGLVNPFLDREPILYIGSAAVSGGIISMLTLMLKGVFSLMASFILIATTKIDAVCAALRRLHVPDILVTLLLLTYRYIAVITEQVSIMTDAYALRAPGQKGIHFSAWGSFLGQLLLRSMDRANELYQSMQLRGFNGSFCYAEVSGLCCRDAVFGIVSAAVIIALRIFNIADVIGNLFV